MSDVEDFKISPDAARILVDNTFGHYKVIGRAVSGFVGGLAEIFETEAWAPLGHRDFTALWIAYDMGGYKLPAEIRKGITQRIREERPKATENDIAIWEGVSRSTVRKDLGKDENVIKNITENLVMPLTSTYDELVYTSEPIFVEAEVVEETSILEAPPEPTIWDLPKPTPTYNPIPRPPRPSMSSGERSAEQSSRVLYSVETWASKVGDGLLSPKDSAIIIENIKLMRDALDVAEKQANNYLTGEVMEGPTPNQRAQALANWYLGVNDTASMHGARSAFLPFIKSSQNYTDDELQRAAVNLTNEGWTLTHNTLEIALGRIRGKGRSNGSIVKEVIMIDGKEDYSNVQL